MNRPASGAQPPAKKVPGPRYALAAVSKTLRLALFTKTRATRLVAERLGVGEPEAETFIRKKLRNLVEVDYVESVELPFDKKVIADVYGVVDEHGAWYIKFYEDNGRFLVCSCHEPEYDMTCQSGAVLKVRT